MILFISYIFASNLDLSSSEISCKECGQHFDTIDALQEHEKSEKEEKELQNKGLWITKDWTSKARKTGNAQTGIVSKNRLSSD